MPYVLPGGRKVSPDQGFVLDDIQYPPNWLRHATEQDKSGLGITWENDPPPVEPVIDLAQLKAQLSRAVDDDAERVRLKYITPGAGQVLTYQEKFAQASAVQAMGETAANALTQEQREAQFPTISASVGLEAATLWQCSQLVLQRYAAFASLSLVIEKTRLAGKKAITDASDVPSARAAYGAIQWTV